MYISNLVHTYVCILDKCTPLILQCFLPQNLIQINPGGDLRHSITKFYTLFASKAQHSSVFKPVFMVPYYDVFGLGKTEGRRGGRDGARGRGREARRERGRELENARRERSGGGGEWGIYQFR